MYTNINEQMKRNDNCIQISNDVVLMIHKLIHQEYTNVLIKEYNITFRTKCKVWYNWRPIDGIVCGKHTEIHIISNVSVCSRANLPKRYAYSSGNQWVLLN